ncbi:sulfur transferase domain-containing protein [Thalassobaculum sp. OXR-137]|uniref:fused DSP-PTPase phosphatase/NAD kinase-like protein n=1 Tax=Thalassobaculum sp. OXR-137 TaxID=3100173 RepID=UPI002AC9BFC5|nr:sulfur transferase domain-containing protein [Thalassobaculum sp. OXR-137]WPZ32508.1 sulfur transferase domain-containing protein [Thalassobaculum sp. OXR-137]
MVDLPKIADMPDALDAAARRAAWWNLMLVDHGFLRAVFLNKRKVDDDLWRAAQPSPVHLRKAKADGFKTILNLRGPRNDGPYTLEREACAELGLTLVDFPIRSRSALDKPTLLAAIDIWKTLEYPVLMHCKSGADRTGFMATLYLWQHKGVPLRQAMNHLSLRYGHIRQAKTGVIDFFYEQYLKAEAETGIGFRTWVETVYDRDVLNAAFKENWAAKILVDRILRRE